MASFHRKRWNWLVNARMLSRPLAEVLQESGRFAFGTQAREHSTQPIVTAGRAEMSWTSG